MVDVSKLSCDEPTANLVPQYSRQQSQSSQAQLNRLLGNIDPERLMLFNEEFYAEVERQRERQRYYRYFFLIFWILILIFILTFVFLLVTNHITFKYSLGTTRRQIIGGTSF